MKGKKVLVTGGEGFIGTALAKKFAPNADVWVSYDSFSANIHHGFNRNKSNVLSTTVTVKGDVCDKTLLFDVVNRYRPDVVIHLAAETSVDKSVVNPFGHVGTNVGGTKVLLDVLQSVGSVQRIVLASSRAVYGEGQWRDSHGVTYYPLERSTLMLSKKIWGFPGCTALPSSFVSTIPAPCNVYGETKLKQEQLVTEWGREQKVGVGVVRLHNVYGPGQSPVNPHTGIVNAAMLTALRGGTVRVAEDGENKRDFVFIDDAVRAFGAVCDTDDNGAMFVDVGSGEISTVGQMGSIVSNLCNVPPPIVTGLPRVGDIRDTICDMGPSLWVYGSSLPTGLVEGLGALKEWLGEFVESEKE